MCVYIMRMRVYTSVLLCSESAHSAYFVETAWLFTAEISAQSSPFLFFSLSQDSNGTSMYKGALHLSVSLSNLCTFKSSLHMFDAGVHLFSLSISVCSLFTFNITPHVALSLPPTLSIFIVCGFSCSQLLLLFMSCSLQLLHYCEVFLPSFAVCVCPQTARVALVTFHCPHKATFIRADAQSRVHYAEENRL